MITTTFFHLFSQISLSSRKYFVSISLFCLLVNFLVLLVWSMGWSDRLIKMAGKRVWERKKRRENMNFRIFIVIFLTLSEANGKVTKTYKKRSQSYNYYSFNLKSPATKTIFWIYGLMFHFITNSFFVLGFWIYLKCLTKIPFYFD